MPLREPLKTVFFSLIPIPSPKEKGYMEFLEVPLIRKFGILPFFGKG